MAVYHKGENIYTTSLLASPAIADIDLPLYEAVITITDRFGRVFQKIEEANDMVQVDKDNGILYIFIPSELTETMEGIYYIEAELWYNGQKLMTNELQRIEVIR
jgi:hypothetical protein